MRSDNLEKRVEKEFLNKLKRSLRSMVFPFSIVSCLSFGCGDDNKGPTEPEKVAQNSPPDTEINYRITGNNVKVSYKGSDPNGYVVNYEILLEGDFINTGWVRITENTDLLDNLSDGNYVLKARAIDNEGASDPSPYEVRFTIGDPNVESKNEITVTENSITLRNRTDNNGQIAFTNEFLMQPITAEARDANNNKPLEEIVVTYIGNKKNNSAAVVFEDTTGNYFSDIQYIFPTSGKPAGESKIFSSMNPASQAPFAIRSPKKVPEYLDKSEYDSLGTFPLSDIGQVYKENDFFARDASIIEFISKNSSHPSVVLLAMANEARNTILEYTSDVTRAIGNIFGGTMDPDAMYWNVYRVDIMGFPIVTKDLNTEDELCTVKGIVTDDVNNPLSEVSVSSKDNQTSSDSVGYYRLIRIKKGIHKIIFKREGFESFSLDTLIQPHPEFISTRINVSLKGAITNKAPNKPFNSYPSNGAVNVPLEVLLDWIGNDPDNDKLTYTIYFEKNNSTPGQILKTGLTESEVRVSNLENDVEYYWQIIASDGKLSTAGDVWRFKVSSVESTPIQGELIFFSVRSSTRGIYSINADGSNSRSLTDDSDFFPTWSPDGTRIAFVRLADIDITDLKEEEIYTMNADGTNLRKLADREASYWIYNDVTPLSWSPDGTKIVFDSNKDIYSINIDGDDLRKLTNNSNYGRSPFWSSNGTKIIFQMGEAINVGHIYIMNDDGSNLTELESPPAHNWNNTSSPWSPDGTKIIYRNWDGSNVYIVDANGADYERLYNLSIREDPVWSLDGSKIAFSSRGYNNNYNLYVMNADGSNVIRLSDDSKDNLSPTWSPDGTKIAFIRGSLNSGDIYVIDADGTDLRNLTNNFAWYKWVGWSPR